MAIKVGGTTTTVPTPSSDDTATDTTAAPTTGETPSVNAAELLEKTGKLVEKTAELNERFDAAQTVKDLHDVSKEFKTTVTKAQAILSGSASKSAEGAEQAAERSRIGRHLGVASAVVGVATLPGKAMTAYSDVRQAFKTGSAAGRDHAVGTVSDAVSTAVATADSGIGIGKRLLSKSATETATKVAEKATEHAVAHAAEEAGVKVVEHAAEKVALKTGLKVAGKAGGLLVPGVNIALAAADAGTFYSAMKDPTASKGRKITTGITALGSALAATDIPVVGWIGDAVSIGGTIAQGFFSK